MIPIPSPEPAGVVLTGDPAALRRNELRYRALVETFADFVWVAAPDGRLLTDIPLWRTITGQSPEGLLGSGWLDGVHDEDRQRAERVWGRAVATHRIYDVEYRITGPGGERWLHVRGAPILEDGELVEWIGTAVDVTARKAGEETERRLRLALDSERRTLEQVVEQAPTAVAVLVGRDHEFRYFNDRYCDLLPPGRTLRRGDKVIDALPEAKDVLPVLDRVLGGETCRFEDLGIPFDDEHSYDGFRFYEVTYSPLVEHDEVTGVVTVAVETTERVRRRAGLEEELRAEREVAEQLQRAVLPESLVAGPGVELAVHYQPASARAGVGGDFYDALLLDDDHVLLVIGDVGGRGLPAATAMSQVRSATRAYALLGLRPGEILDALSTLCSRTELADIVTAGVGMLDVRAGRLTWASAGHLPPLLLEPGRAPRFSEVPADPPLGAGVTGYGELEIDVAPGGSVVLYTDGVVERRDRSLTDTLEELRSAVPADAAGPRELCRALAAFALGGQGTDDDAAIMVCSLAAGGPGA